MTTDVYEEKLVWFKENEKPEVLLIIESSPWLVQIVVAWLNMSSRKKDNLSALQYESEAGIWNWLWENTEYSTEELKMLGNFKGIDFEKALSTLIGNRILYPDCTIHSFVQRYLREKVIMLFDQKAKKLKKEA